MSRYQPPPHLRPPVINPYDQLSATQFDSFVGDISAVIQNALNPGSVTKLKGDRSFFAVGSGSKGESVGDTSGPFLRPENRTSGAGNTTSLFWSPALEDEQDEAEDSFAYLRKGGRFPGKFDGGDEELLANEEEPDEIDFLSDPYTDEDGRTQEEAIVLDSDSDNEPEAIEQPDFDESADPLETAGVYDGELTFGGNSDGSIEEDEDGAHEDEAVEGDWPEEVDYEEFARHLVQPQFKIPETIMEEDEEVMEEDGGSWENEDDAEGEAEGQSANRFSAPREEASRELGYPSGAEDESEDSIISPDADAEMDTSTIPNNAGDDSILSDDDMVDDSRSDSLFFSDESEDAEGEDSIPTYIPGDEEDEEEDEEDGGHEMKNVNDVGEDSGSEDAEDAESDQRQDERDQLDHEASPQSGSPELGAAATLPQHFASLEPAETLDDSIQLSTDTGLQLLDEDLDIGDQEGEDEVDELDSEEHIVAPDVLVLLPDSSEDLANLSGEIQPPMVAATTPEPESAALPSSPSANYANSPSALPALATDEPENERAMPALHSLPVEASHAAQGEIPLGVDSLLLPATQSLDTFSEDVEIQSLAENFEFYQDTSVLSLPYDVEDPTEMSVDRWLPSDANSNITEVVTGWVSQTIEHVMHQQSSPDMTDQIIADSNDDASTVVAADAVPVPSTDHKDAFAPSESMDISHDLAGGVATEEEEAEHDEPVDFGALPSFTEAQEPVDVLPSEPVSFSTAEADLPESLPPSMDDAPRPTALVVEEPTTLTGAVTQDETVPVVEEISDASTDPTSILPADGPLISAEVEAEGETAPLAEEISNVSTEPPAVLPAEEATTFEGVEDLFTFVHGVASQHLAENVDGDDHMAIVHPSVSHVETVPTDEDSSSIPTDSAPTRDLSPAPSDEHIAAPPITESDEPTSPLPENVQDGLEDDIISPADPEGDVPMAPANEEPEPSVVEKPIPPAIFLSTAPDSEPDEDPSDDKTPTKDSFGPVSQFDPLPSQDSKSPESDDESASRSSTPKAEIRLDTPPPSSLEVPHPSQADEDSASASESNDSRSTRSRSSILSRGSIHSRSSLVPVIKGKFPIFKLRPEVVIPSTPQHRHHHGPPRPSTSDKPTSSESYNSPVTRSNCRFHKISVPASGPDAVIHFIVPGCALSARDVMKREGIIDCGEATKQDNKHKSADMSNLDPDIISTLRKLVGIDLLHEGVCAYLPSAAASASISRSASRKLPKRKRASTAGAEHGAEGTSGLRASPARSVALSDVSAGSSSKPPSTASQGSLNSPLRQRRGRSSLAPREDLAYQPPNSPEPDSPKDDDKRKAKRRKGRKSVTIVRGADLLSVSEEPAQASTPRATLGRKIRKSISEDSRYADEDSKQDAAAYTSPSVTPTPSDAMIGSPSKGRKRGRNSDLPNVLQFFKDGIEEEEEESHQVSKKTRLDGMTEEEERAKEVKTSVQGEAEGGTPIAEPEQKPESSRVGAEAKAPVKVAQQTSKAAKGPTGQTNSFGSKGGAGQPKPWWQFGWKR
ncbi:hypothetical protein BOTBODRAFT_27405 [Botryobasidium botryosum FD-172 SS1]|uniref:Uncharacterized protein n=1 Tax=Botryobasidium botryosum (strain FD-172 SS1) TaxID=930990 RepID=A0A067MWL3_BOTB1|nr:hypothetical protein BOTBODRAFT_27405 [Botryobasidium botryosum FD-172 SS1]